MNSSSSADLLFATFVPFLFVASYHSALPSLWEAPAPGPRLVTRRVPTDARGLGLQPRAGLTLGTFWRSCFAETGALLSSLTTSCLLCSVLRGLGTFSAAPGHEARLVFRQILLLFVLLPLTGNSKHKKNAIRCDILSNSTTPR